MTRNTPEVRDFAKRLIALEANGHKSSETKIPAACMATEKLRPHLSTLIGNLGFRALISRALALANADVRWLRAVHVKTDGSFEGFEDLSARMEPEQFFEGCTVLLSHLLGLLVAFVGEEITLRLVGDVWPELSSNDLVFGKGDEK